MLTKDIAQALAGRLDGDGAIRIERLVHPAKAETATDLALALNAEAVGALAQSKAQVAVVTDKTPPARNSFRALITVGDPRVALAKLTALFDHGPSHDEGVHPTAVIAPDAEIGAGANIGAYATVGARSRIGARTTVMPHVTIGADVAIGENGLFHSGVRIGDRVTIGARAIVHSNAVIGADGFSFAPALNSPFAFTADVKLTRVHSLGSVVIGDDVEIGACVTIDRATIEATCIGSGTKIDNHVHIGHNVTIGESCVLCGMVGLSGSVTLGNRVRLGGGVGVGDHRHIGDQAVVAAGSGVATNIPAGAFVSGYPAIPHERSLENIQLLSRQKRLHQKVKDMSARLDVLERSNKDGEPKT